MAKGKGCDDTNDGELSLSWKICIIFTGSLIVWTVSLAASPDDPDPFGNYMGNYSGDVVTPSTGNYPGDVVTPSSSKILCKTHELVVAGGRRETQD